MPLRLSALFIHFLTASGAGLGLMALFCAIGAQFSEMFFWLGAALFVDAIDGPLARRLEVTRNAPRFDGVVLDLVVDYLTYVIVPLVALSRSALLISGLAAPVCAVIAAASALYFGDREMKTQDNWFRGFPALWNILVFYLLVFAPAPTVTLAIVLAFTALMFAPFVFVHPLRVKRLRRVTLIMTGLWGIAALVATWQGLASASYVVKAALMAAAGYFAVLPLFREQKE